MSKKNKEKNKKVVVETVDGLYYNNNVDKILNYVLIGLCLLCLLSLVIPVIHIWYPISDNPNYRTYLLNGFQLMFGGQIEQNIVTSTSHKYPLESISIVRAIIAYATALIGFAGAFFVLSVDNMKNKKFFYLIRSMFFIASTILFALLCNHVVTEIKNATGALIRHNEFTFYGIILIVVMGVSSLISLYQSVCTKIVKK